MSVLIQEADSDHTKVVWCGKEIGENRHCILPCNICAFQ